MGDLSSDAVCLSSSNKPEPFPARVAVVIGRESDGVSREMLQAAHKRVYLPMYGFTESFNLSVATALTIQRLMDWCPDARGDLSAEETSRIRQEWYSALAKNPTAQQKYKHWVEHPELVGTLTDLRRQKDANNSWIP